MVSQLSARLMNGYSSSSDNSTTTGSNSNSKPTFSAVAHHHRRNATGTVSASAGYCADMESSLGDNSSVDASASAPFYVGVNRKHESSGVIDSRSPKRRQILEMTYLASRATIELARAKKTAPVMRKNPLVNHMTSSSLDSAFLTPKSPSNGLSGQDYATSIGDIMQACSSFYAIPAHSLVTKEDSTLSGSSTSSVSNSDLDEASTNDAEPALVTMNEALSLSKEARYVYPERFQRFNAPPLIFPSHILHFLFTLQIGHSCLLTICGCSRECCIHSRDGIVVRCCFGKTVPPTLEGWVLCCRVSISQQHSRNQLDNENKRYSVQSQRLASWTGPRECHALFSTA